jgi:23S rRNA pseudouridine1911/1915/1917 synthase
MEFVKNDLYCEITNIDEFAGMTVEQFLRDVLLYPKKLLHELRMDKGVKVNKEIIPWRQIIQNGDSIEILMFKEEEYGVIPENLNVEVCYEDDYLLIVNKPIGMDTHPNKEGQLHTLANAVAYHYQSNGISAKVRHIHRLDQDTSGGVVFAKHPLSHAILDKMLADRLIKRTYTAIVEGKLKEEKGTINASIGRDRYHPTRRRVSPNGEKAITHFQVINYRKKENFSIIKCQLDTGRTHQIRVHLSSIGHPLVGDELYGGKTKLLRRQALHAANIKLTHPFTKEQIDVNIPFPDDLEKLMSEKK